MGEGLYGVAELAELGGVSRRTVRYYIQEDLLPAPLGVGRGRHYGREHLDRLVRVKALQELGLSLAEVRVALQAPSPSSEAPPSSPRSLPPPGRGGLGRVALRAAAAPALEHDPPVQREAWTRLVLAPGIELAVSSARRLPSPARLAQLARWCRAHIRTIREEGDV
jgi:DNA-binding transcriptional MerR regulator